jgi:hypothetical protein
MTVTLRLRLPNIAIQLGHKIHCKGYVSPSKMNGKHVVLQSWKPGYEYEFAGQ